MNKEWLGDIITKEFPDGKFDVLIPPSFAKASEGRSDLGDFSINLAFDIAKKEKKSPAEAGREIVERLSGNNDFKKVFKKIEFALPGFVNFYFSEEFLRKSLKDIYGIGGSFGSSQKGAGQKIIVDYSQPNIAKRMHVGHFRSTIIGDAIANMHKFLGYDVIRWNYLGDWGTQFGKLIAAYKMWGDKKIVEAKPIETLMALYVRFHDELKSNLELEDKGRQEFKKLEDGDAENRKLWEWFKNESLKEFDKIYKLLGVGFDTYEGESFFEKQMKPLVDGLMKNNIAQESQGSQIISLDKYGLPPALIQKSDGASLYITRDIASLKYRVSKYNPAKIIYVVGNEQSLHFQQLFAIADILGLGSAELDHVKFGLVLGEDGKKLSTREGKVVLLEEVIQKVIGLAVDVVKEKNPKLSEEQRQSIAEAVGIGALKYNDLRENRHSDIIFDWSRMLNISGDSGPYLQYTYARLTNIKRKAGWLAGWMIGRSNGRHLETEQDLLIIRKVLNFPDVVSESATMLLPNILALYLYELANLANAYYASTPILKDENKKRRNDRLMLIGVTASVLKTGLNLLGIQTPERI